MTRRRSRLILIALAVCAATFYFHCTQPEDIMTPVSRTDVYLTAYLLPTNPDGMLYELWVANGQDTLSLGKFGYHQTWKTFYDEDGEEKPDTNKFVLDGDILDYSHIFVSVEAISGDLPQSPGPIMLIDDVTEPSSNPIELCFPLNQTLTGYGTAFFNMETPSDSGRDSTNAGCGIWFSAFYWSLDSVRDTLSLDDFDLVTKQMDTLPEGTEDTFTTYVVNIVNDSAYYIGRVFGLDTMWNWIVRFDSIIDTDFTAPYTVIDDTATVLYYTVDPDHDSVADTFHYERFIQFDYGLPNYSDYRWKYKGWVVSPEVPPTALGKITLPAYTVNTTKPGDSLIPGVEGGLLTTGTFSDISAPDDGNPHRWSPRVPPIAGEDFLKNLPGGLEQSWQGLVPHRTDNSGTVFITLEPDNFVTDTTNFPLFVLVQSIPTDRYLIFQSALADTQLFDMWNLTNTNDPHGRGFPKIVVDIRRF